jgi:hypothetical protein
MWTCGHVWSKAPIGCKKYPAVAGYLMKMEQSSTKRMALIGCPIFLLNLVVLVLIGVFLIKTSGRTSFMADLGLTRLAHMNYLKAPYFMVFHLDVGISS